MIWLGPAGVPISSKDRSTLGGLKTISELKLNAMEVEFVRRVGMSNEIAEQVGKLAKELNVRLSVHCPYFVNLCSQEKEKLDASKKRILDSCERAFFMQADIAVFHPGFYGKLTPEQAFDAVKEACEDLIERMKSKGIKGVRLGLETMGKQASFGTLDEIIEICRKVKNCSPVIDWAHIYARQAGRINYAEIFNRLKPLKLEHLHTHVTCVEFAPIGMTGKGNERYHLELKAKKPDFEPLVKEILKRKIDITLISESPVLEKDALILKKMFEKYGYKF